MLNEKYIKGTRVEMLTGKHKGRQGKVRNPFMGQYANVYWDGETKSKSYHVKNLKLI